MRHICEKIDNVNPKVEWCEKLGGNNLRFTFRGYLTEMEAEQAIVEWEKAFNQRKGQTINLIWDCIKMREYDRGARRKWTTALMEMKSQVGGIWLITESPVIRMGATIMGIATSLNIRTINSDKDLKV